MSENVDTAPHLAAQGVQLLHACLDFCMKLQNSKLLQQPVLGTADTTM